jgi:hypothetical protein
LINEININNNNNIDLINDNNINNNNIDMICENNVNNKDSSSSSSSSISGKILVYSPVCYSFDSLHISYYLNQIEYIELSLQIDLGQRRHLKDLMTKQNDHELLKRKIEQLEDNIKNEHSKLELLKNEKQVVSETDDINLMNNLFEEKYINEINNH